MKAYFKYIGLTLAALFFALVMSFDDVHGADLLTRAGLSENQRLAIHRWWFDAELWRVTVELDPEITENPSDGNCYFAAKIFHKLAIAGYEVMVLSREGYVPTRVNPMDVSWTLYLTETADP